MYIVIFISKLIVSVLHWIVNKIRFNLAFYKFTMLYKQYTYIRNLYMPVSVEESCCQVL